MRRCARRWFTSHSTTNTSQDYSDGLPVCQTAAIRDTRQSATSMSPPIFQPPATTHATHIPHPSSARLPIVVVGSTTGGSLPSSLPSRLNTGSPPPPPPPTTPIMRSTSPPIASLITPPSHLRPSPLGGSPPPANRNSSTHSGGILPPASFRATGNNSTGRALGQSITSPTTPPTGSAVPAPLPFKNTTPPAGDRTLALLKTVGGLTLGKRLPIGEVRASSEELEFT